MFTICSYSGSSETFGSGRKQNTGQAGARGRESCCTFHKVLKKAIGIINLAKHFQNFIDDTMI